MSGFEQSQQDYYLRQINRAIPVMSHTADLGTIQAALGVVDPAMPEDTTAMTDAVQFMSTFGRKTDAMTRDAECRALPMPGDAMRPDVGARTGCGWWFVPDAGAPSVGAYGTRRGPMNPRMDDQFGAGQWIWEPREAQRQEELKRAARVTDCGAMSASPIADRLAWCADTGMAVVVNADGSPRYPTAPGGDCPSVPTRTCPVAPSGGGGSGGGSGSGAGGICAPGTNNSLSPACIQQQIANGGTCSTSGGLYQALNGGYATNATFATLNGYLSPGTAAAPAGILGPAAMTTDQISGYTQALARASAGGTPREQLAAQALCYNMNNNFDPCSVMQPTDQPPFPEQCIVSAARAAGYSMDAGIMPSQIGMDYWNGKGQGTVGGSWANVLTNISTWKQIADNPDQPGNPPQSQGIWNVYGVSMKYPRSGCNNTGMYIYRYYYNTAAPSTIFNGAGGPHTHFLGRYLVKQTDSFWNTPTTTSAPIMPTGGTNVEAQRYVTVFRPTTGGNYQFLVTCTDYMRFTILDSTGATVSPFPSTPPWQNTTSTVAFPSATLPAALIAGQEYTMIFDVMANSGSWTMDVKMFINGQGPTPIDGTQLYLPYDRRQPMFELAFNKMPTGTGTRDMSSLKQVSDTNGLFQNLAFYRNANIGTLAGKTCMLVNNGGIYNFNQFSQGIRAHAFRSMTLMINVTSYQNSRDGKTAPSLISFYNVNTIDPTDMTLHGAPAPTWDYGNRTQDMSIFMTGGAAAFQYKDVRDPSILPQYFYNAVPLPMGEWHHIAIVWDDDFQGYAFFMDGALKGQLRATGPGVGQLFEQMRIGSDATDDGAGWQGGIAWFRAFDYRLSVDQIQMDMNDNWASLN